MKKVIILFFLVLIFNAGFAQNAAIKVKNPKYVAYIDSLKTTEYNYVFPIYGEKVYHRGFDIPYPAGIMFNSFNATQNMVIDEISLGVNNSEMVDFSNFITFSQVQTQIRNINIRPDLYIFPFWNVYGILGYNWSETSVTLSSPIFLETTAKLEGYNYGIGTNLAAGVGPVWVSADANMVWADLDKFVEPVKAVNTSFRIGHTFPDYDKPHKNVAIWVGAFGSFIDNRTSGSINLSELVDESKAQEIRDQIDERFQDWYDQLNGPQQKVVDEILDRVEGREPTDVVIHYDLLKRPANPWNMLLGFQYQFNKNWQIRGEAGFFGERTQFLASLNYRFRI